jgi:hypothetical protein
MTNRTLVVIFISCLILFLAGKFFRGHRQSSFDPVLSSLDTNKVDRIKFISGGATKEEFELIKSGDKWEAVQGSKKVPANFNNVHGVINTLSDLEAKRVITTDATRYPEYEITDEQAARVIAWEGKKQVTDLWVGGFKFDQAARSASSYIRRNKGNEVFLVDGFLSMSLKQKFNQYRDKKLVNSGAEDLSSLEWMDASGNKKVLQKENGLWYYAGMEALDSSAINQYLNSLTSTQGIEFSDLSSTAGLDLREKLTLYGNNMVDPTVISAFISQDTIKPFLIHSTVNPDAVFYSDSSGIYKRIFGDLRQFWPDAQ